jgi:hypothetical protein
MPAAERLPTRRAKRTLLQLLSLGALIAAVSLAVLAEPKAEPAPGEAALVLGANTTLGDALRAGDKSAARKLLALQFTYTDAGGAVHARKEFLADLKSAAAAPAADVKTAVYGTVAVVTGHRKTGQDDDTFLLHIWAKQKGAWRILTMQDVGLGPAVAAPGEPDVPGVQASVYACKNPCVAIPYRVRSPAEQEVVNAFQAIQKARVAHDAEEWGKHIADEFMHYRSGYAPISKSSRIAAIKEQKDQKAPAVLSAIQTMRLWVFGDGAAMISSDGVGDDSEPLLRVARVWVKRNGQWQMALSAQTVIKNPAQQ